MLQVTRLHNENRLIDYVSQEDVIPYRSSESTPVNNRLVKEFFTQEETGSIINMHSFYT